jgi:aryl-alcohol dehydrogenase-like predicted oxidoreductase
MDFTIADRVGEVATRVGISRAQVALAWILQKPGVTCPVVGTTKLAHVEDLVRALEIKLTDEDVAHLEAPYRPKRVLGM